MMIHNHVCVSLMHPLLITVYIRDKNPSCARIHRQSEQIFCANIMCVCVCVYGKGHGQCRVCCLHIDVNATWTLAIV